MSLMVLASALLPISSASPTTWSAAPTTWSVSPTAAQDADEFGPTYLRLNAGLVTMEESDGPDEEIDFDEGYLLGLAIGQRMSSGQSAVNFALELEGLWTDQDADDDGPIESIQDVSVIGAMLNGVLDFRVADRLSLYAGAGIGASWMDIGTESDALNDFDDEDGPFLSWQAKAGLMWRTSANTAVSFGYRFLNIDDVEIDDDLGNAEFDLETQQHALELGLTFGI